MNQYDPYSDPRFDDRLNETDARNRQHARQWAAEARSQSRSVQEGSYASGQLSPTSRHSTRNLRNHYDAREEFARLDEEARDRDMRRIARQHGIAPRSVGERPSDPYERADIERLPARRLRERAEGHGHGAENDEYRSERYRDRSRARVEDIEDPARLDRIHHSGDRPRRGREPEPQNPLAALLGSLPFFGGGSREKAEEPRRSTRSRREGERPARREGERPSRAQRVRDGERPSSRRSAERDGRVEEERRSRQRASESARQEAREPQEGYASEETYREGERLHTEFQDAEDRRRSRERGPHSVGVARTQAQWRSRNGRVRSDRQPRGRSREGFSARRNQVDLSPVGGGIMPSMSGLPLGLIVRVVVAIAAIALVVFVGSNIANAIAMAQTVTVTVDGTEQKVAGKKDVDALLNSGVSTEPGNLVAVDGSVLAEGGGYPATVTVNGELVTDYSTPLAEHAEIELSPGGDITEPYYVEEREKKGEAKESGNGPIHHIVESTPGKERVRVGETSGKTVTEETLEEGSPRLYARQYVDTGGEKVIALTFDDGPLPEYTNQILDILKENDAKATFFTLGQRIEEEGGAELVKREAEEGHQVCTHTYDHAAGSGQGVNLSYMTADEQREEVQKGQDAIKAATGQDANRAFRAPGGNFPLEVWQNVESLITAEIGWTIDTTDWQLPGSSAIYEQIVSAGPGDVLLMHDGGGDRQQTVDALREALPALKEKGYRFVTIDELMQYALVDEWTDSSAQADEGGEADGSEDAGNSDSDAGSESGDNEGNE